MPVAPSPPSGPLARWLVHPGAINAHVLHRLEGAASRILTAGWPAVAAAAAVVVLGLAAGTLRGARQARGGRWVAVAPPAEPDPAGGAALWAMLDPLLARAGGLLRRRLPLAFECAADAEGLRIGLWVPPRVPLAGVTRAIESAWPGARATPTGPPELPKGRSLAWRARLALPDWLPLGAGSAGGADPVAAVLSALGGVGSVSALLQVLVRPARARLVSRARRAARALRRGQPATGLGRSLGLLHTGCRSSRASTSTDPLALADVRSITAKALAAPHFEVAVRLAVVSPEGTPRRQGRISRRARARQVGSALGLAAGRNHLICRRLLRAGVVGRRRLRRGFLLSLPELAALAHLPAAPPRYGLPAAPARRLAPPSGVAHG